MKSIRIILAGMLIATVVHGGDNPATEDSTICLGCHDFGPKSPVHAVLAGSHGLSGDTAAMAGRRGCPDCHGASNDHAKTPAEVSPEVSFGPRWTATAAAQDRQCLICHEENVARNWKHALHMVNNLTCVTCHDIHSWQDKVLFEDEQAKVCTICHKTQKLGIHGMQDMAARNPPCSSCHNPHDHESAQARMLDNGSQGCRACHNPSEVPAIYSASQKANSYHQVMTQADRTCLDCHQGIAHAATGLGPATPPIALASKKITLFYPGMADSDWLLQDHPGSQPLRQGRNCQQCHRGEEAGMGEIQANGFKPAFRDIQVAFARNENSLSVTLQWRGAANDASVAIMWGDGGNEAFRRGGCFAACHSDLPGMSRDRGAQTGKYLWVSRAQQQGIGQAPVIRDPTELKQLAAQGDYVELWRVQLDSGKAGVATLLADLTWQPAGLLAVSRSYNNGQWTVELRRGLDETDFLKTFSPTGKYSFGIALNGAGNPGGRHWVSLPQTLSFDGDETDFKME